MTSETKRIIRSMTPVERRMYRSSGGTIPRGIKPAPAVWKEPNIVDRVSPRNGTRPPTAVFEVNGEILHGSKAVVQRLGCTRGAIESLRGERMVKGVLVKRVSAVAA